MTVRISFPEIPDALVSCLMTGENYVNGLNLDIKLLELIRFYVSEINQCAYCIDMHYKEAIKEGEEAQRLYSVSVFEETNFYSKQEQAILKWTKAITLIASPSNLDSLYTELSQFYSKETIANLTMAVIQINAWNRIAKSFGFEAGTYQSN